MSNTQKITAMELTHEEKELLKSAITVIQTIPYLVGNWTARDITDRFDYLYDIEYFKTKQENINNVIDKLHNIYEKL